MERQNATPVKIADSIVELMSEANIDEFSSSYDSSGGVTFIDGSPTMDADEFSALAKGDDPAVLKSWREGFEIKSVDDAAAKTVFISQNLNKEYEKQESKLKFISYNSSAAKVVREIDYFTMILNRAGDDLKLTEHRTDREKIFEKREVLKKRLTAMKATVDVFIAQNLEGEPLTGVPVQAKSPPQPGVAEYAFLGDNKKPAASEKYISLNMCTDCNIEIVAEEGQDLDAAMVAHSQTELHKASMPEPPPPRKSKLEGVTGQPAGEPADKKSIDNLKRSPILKLNRIAGCLIDDNMTCEVCDVTFPSHMQDIYKHMNENSHKEKLNTFNIEVQKSIIERHPDVFGDEGQFQLNYDHTNLHKIFVDPTIKQAYCGLCCRQLPFSQSNIDEHIRSGKHEKLLSETIESSFDDFVALGFSSATLSNYRIKGDEAEAVGQQQNLKPKREPPPSQQNMSRDQQNMSRDQQNMPRDQQNMSRDQQNMSRDQQQKDSQTFLDVADIQNFRKVLPDKPIRSIPDILDSNNMPIHNYDYYDQPELKKFLIDNGLQRQAGGKFKCVYCPNLDFPNSRYAVRHINKHKMGSGNSQCFDNWKRPSNRLPYNNEPKLGRVVMHKNGVNYWCTSCRLPLIDASTAFAHVKTDNHHMYVDGVSFSSGTIFDCSTCKTTINGEKNACQHLVAIKHRENSKMETMAKMEGRMNMIEERKQKQYEKQRQKEMYSGNNEDKVLEKHGVIYTPESGTYHCSYCRWSSKKHPEVMLHIFSYEHVEIVNKQQR